jgi:hypothetical protein
MKNTHKLQAFNLETNVTFVHETFIHFICFLGIIVVKPTQVTKKKTRVKKIKMEQNLLKLNNITKKDIMKRT